jgi:UPF0755 protein
MSDLRRDARGDDVDVLSQRLSSIGRVTPKSPTEALQPEPVPPPPPRSRASRHPIVVVLNFFITLAVVAAVIAGSALVVGKIQFDRSSSLDQSRAITVDKGDDLRTIADRLQKNGVISSKWLFIAGVWFNKQQAGLKAGEYLVPAHASMRDIMDAMVSGKGILYSITVPEGLTSQQIVDRITQEDTLVGDIPEVPPEGSLLPETYKFTRGDTRQNLIARMRRERDRVVTEIWSHRAPDLPIANIDQFVVLASIVEKETALADERSRVAAVFINRLRLNMKLQSDPTTIYGLFGGKGKPSGYSITRSDLDSRTPFNTYVIAGLPPTPIANPGRASLEAVANPSRTRDLYFVADGSGGHAFSETYEDHLRNVSRWRQINGNANNNGGGPGDAAGGADAAPAPVPVPSGSATPMALQPVKPAGQ